MPTPIKPDRRSQKKLQKIHKKVRSIPFDIYQELQSLYPAPVKISSLKDNSAVDTSSLPKKRKRHKTRFYSPLNRIRPGIRTKKKSGKDKKPRFLKQKTVVRKRRLIPFRLFLIFRPAKWMGKRVGPPNQYVIEAKDVARLLNRSLRSAQRIIKKIKKYYDKPDRCLITVTDFCNYYGFNEQSVQKMLQE